MSDFEDRQNQLLIHTRFSKLGIPEDILARAASSAAAMCEQVSIQKGGPIITAHALDYDRLLREMVERIEE
jgi:hypothetical protein